MNDQQSPLHAWPPQRAALLSSGEADRGNESASSGGVREAFRVLSASVVALSVWTAICLIGAGVYLFRSTPEFVASTQVVLEARRVTSGADLSSENYGAMLDSAQADSQVQVVKSERSLRYVFETLDLANDPTFTRARPGLTSRLTAWLSFGARRENPSAAEAAATERARAFQAFADRISVRRLGLSYVLEISFRAPTAKQAARLANAVTAAYIRDSIDYRAAAAQRGTEILQDRITAIRTEQDLAAEAVRKGALPDAAFPDSDIRVISGALEPLGSAYPQYNLILLLAACFGLVSGAGAALARHALDRKIRTRQQIGRLLRFERVSAAPRFEPSPRAPFIGDPADNSPFNEAMRVLRTAILSTKTGSRRISVGIVSWSPGEGKSVVAGRLAMLIGAARQPVTLIDADFRHPALSRALAPKSPLGLDEALLAHATERADLFTSLGEHLTFVPATAGAKGSNPDVFLGSAEMARFVRKVGERCDIILDLPALSLSAETQAIADLLDGVILVVEADRTSVDELSEAFSTLRNAGVSVLRIVLNKASAAEWRGAKSKAVA